MKDGDITALLNMVENLAVTTGAAVALAGHYAKGNAAAKESIDRISGRGVFARDPDSLITFTKHEEEVIGTGWQSFVQVGLAFTRIRDARLYRMEFDTFEAYSQNKWQYGHRYVNRLISAAQVFTYLGTSSCLKQPEHETQVRPLVGLRFWWDHSNDFSFWHLHVGANEK